ncbi:ribonuclease I [Neokomagataea tanensis]|uniref:Ribonuclease I n=1 Tax=Neokomagataea tanensis TaxID=661191 RepID=A0A4Y6V2L3_9PROT|nr:MULTISPECIES: ribonuclease I [Neokomagataea]QDH24282.1 ribonuclease I [Neokomagataea tanensis]
MKHFLLAVFFVVAGCSETNLVPPGAGITPTHHADFRHDTLALTWQPGFCLPDKPGHSCTSDQPKTPLIGLHGLWASEPTSLEAQGVPVQKWWMQGCGLLDGGQEQTLSLRPETSAALSAVMPHFEHPLVTHEYTKHVQCFGYPADDFFVSAMTLRSRFEASAFGRYLANNVGYRVQRDELLAQFKHLSGVTAERGLQFQCSKRADGQAVLSQIWMTLDPQKLDSFPQSEAFMSSPFDQNSCPASFLVPSWSMVPDAIR